MAAPLKFKVGQTVTCVDDSKFNRFYKETVPVLGSFYVVRSVTGSGASVCLRLRSIINPRHQYTDTFAECSFKASRFLPGKVTMPFFTVRGPLPIVTPAGPFQLDGSAAGNQAAGTTVTATLTTTTANDIIVACFLRNGGAIVSVADVAGLTWNLLGNADQGGGQQITVYYAKSSGILSGDVVTVTLNASTFITLHVFAVSGADFTTPIDANGALPATTAVPATYVSLTTSSANDFLFATYRFGNFPTATAGTGWTTIQGTDYLLTEYKIVSATQTGTSAPIGTNDGDQTSGVGHAIVKAP